MRASDGFIPWHSDGVDFRAQKYMLPNIEAGSDNTDTDLWPVRMIQKGCFKLACGPPTETTSPMFEGSFETSLDTPRYSCILGSSNQLQKILLDHHLGPLSAINPDIQDNFSGYTGCRPARVCSNLCLHATPFSDHLFERRRLALSRLNGWIFKALKSCKRLICIC